MRLRAGLPLAKRTNQLMRGSTMAVQDGEGRKMCHQTRFYTDDKGWCVVKEGEAEILFPTEKDVFYNPVQEFNRDLTIAVIKQHSADILKSRGVEDPQVGAVHPQGLTLLEALAASGLRSVRFAREIPGLKSVLANDWSEQAVESIKRNVEHNRVQDIVQPSNGDACMVMYSHKRFKDRFDVVDLDPYGSPSPFLDAALQSVADGGLLCVTATDMAVLCGNTPETCYTKYGAISLKTKSCHEFALRIVLQCMEAHANRSGRYIQPLLSLSIDFYARVFVRVRTGQAKCKESTSKLGHVFQCTGCEALAFQRLGRVGLHENGTNKKFGLVTGPPVGQSCEHCDSSFHMGGPIWLDPIHDKLFVKQLLDSIQTGEYATEERMQGMLSMVLEELEDVPLYYELSRLTNIVKQSQEKLTLYTSAILNSGYQFSLSHANRVGLKTTAPISFLWDLLRTLGRRESRDPVGNLSDCSPGHKIMSRQPQTEISFEPHPDANPKSRENNLKRFQLNPEANWGPKARSRTSLIPDKPEKQARNQGKHKKPQGGPTNKKPRSDEDDISAEATDEEAEVPASQLQTIVDQKSYVEEVNRNLVTSITNLQAKVERLTTTNLLMKEDLDISTRKLQGALKENEVLQEQVDQAAAEAQRQKMREMEISVSSLDPSQESELEQRLGLEQARLRQVEKELSLEVQMKAECEIAMKLMEKDMHMKQDTIVSLRAQLEDIKAINLEMYTKLSECKKTIEVKTDIIQKLESKSICLLETLQKLDDKFVEAERGRSAASLQLRLAEDGRKERTARVEELQQDLKIEREWRERLQETSLVDREALSKLRQDNSFLKQVSNDYENMRQENQRLKEQNREYDRTLEELGQQLSWNKLQLDSLKEESRGSTSWEKDADATACKICDKEFSIARRKHHCRNCGGIFCDKCSDNKMELPSSAKKLRVCDNCYVLLLERQSKI